MDPASHGPAPEPPSAKALALASACAVVLGLFVFTAFVLPAEYGKDPTHLGRFTGVGRLSEPAVPLPVFQAYWPLQGQAQPVVAGYSAEGTTQAAEFPLQVANVSTVTAYLSWTDANETAGRATLPDTFEVVVVAPDGSRSRPAMARNDAEGRGNVSATLEWRAPPEPLALEGEDLADAAAKAAATQPTDLSAVGTWLVEITLYEAGDAEAGGLSLSGAVVDAGNDWELRVVAESFALTVSSALARVDVVNILVPAGDALEYKVHMEQGGVLNFAWSTTGAITFDFHGESDADGSYTSHKKGSVARDAGQFSAPFTGRHGWYFENGGGEDQVVRLELDGSYIVVGFV